MSRQTGELANKQVSEKAQERQRPQLKALPRLEKQKTREEVSASLSLPNPKSLAALDEQSLSTEGGFSYWQTVIWREWCRSQDEDYAYYLFDLVKDTAFGRKLVVIMALLGVLVGAIIGYLVGSMFAGAGIQVGSWDLTGLPPAILGWTMALAGGTIGVEGSRRFRALYFWWQGQPSASKVERALQQAITRHPGAKQVWAKPLHRLAQRKKQQSQPEQLIDALRSSNWVDRFVARKVLVAMGGEATEALRELAVEKKNPLSDVAIWLLTSIEQETTNRFAWRANQTLCPHCLTRFDARPVELSLGISFTCYSCRVCGQSREFLHLPQGVVAVLDASWLETQVEKDGQLRVNWLIHRASFDFDWIELVQATDEDVERFAVQVGNDTDPFRKSRYRQMRCLIGPNCTLSENTLRILRRMFGQVE